MRGCSYRRSVIRVRDQMPDYSLRDGRRHLRRGRADLHNRNHRTGMSYTIGNYVRMSVEFRDSAGAYVDPTAVEFRVRAPSSTAVSVIAGTRSEMGKYFADVLVDRSGAWVFRAVASGAVVAAVEQSFDVAPSLANFTT